MPEAIGALIHIKSRVECKKGARNGSFFSFKGVEKIRGKKYWCEVTVMCKDEQLEQAKAALQQGRIIRLDYCSIKGPAVTEEQERLNLIPDRAIVNVFCFWDNVSPTRIVQE